MSIDYSHIRVEVKKILSRGEPIALHRQVFILAGGEVWQKHFLKKILQGCESESLWVAEQEQNGFDFIATEKVYSWLGNEKKIVIFDANKEFSPDSFAAISGIVVGGGIFFLLLPEIENWDKVYSSPFGQRLIKSINATAELVLVKETNEAACFSVVQSNVNTAEKVNAPFLTVDQKNTVDSIEAEALNNTLVIVADRGRGKSAALGFAAARLLQSGIKKIAITAPRLRATDIIFKHIADSLSEAEVSRGCVKLGDSLIQFYSPDQLIADNISADLLLVDEAAAIPVPMLTMLLDKFKHCVFATTVHGYEGTGRGFSLRFHKVLNKKSPQWLILTMNTAVRWQAGDPLEKWVFKLLCLDAEIIKISSSSKIPDNKCRSTLINKEQLAENEGLLNEIFSLLVLAHYRTRPSDLKRLLDDDGIGIYVTLFNKHVIAAAIVIHEGGFPNYLSTKVYRGERRPSGHLLAQALTYHCGVEHAATVNYARVMRIVVHPEVQSQGLGSWLLGYIIQQEKSHGRDAIGASFGMTKALLNFWRKAEFDAVRIGFTREKSSGEHAVVMLLPLTDKGENIYIEALARFNRQYPFWFDDILKDIPVALKNNFTYKVSESLELNKFDNKDIESFTRYSRNYELCIAALNKLVLLKQASINQEEFPSHFRLVLNNKITNKTSWKEIANNMNLTGKNEARRYFHQAICYLIEDDSYTGI